MAVFGKDSLPSRPARRNRQRILSMADAAKFALQGLLIDHGVVSSLSADSGRAVAHESASRIGTPKCRINDDERALPGTRDLWRCGAGGPGNVESTAGALQCIRLALPRFVKLSNWAGQECDVSLGSDGGRKNV